MAKGKKQSKKKPKSVAVKEVNKEKSITLDGFPSFFSNKKVASIILFAFSFLLYANTLGHDYTQDDAIVIYENDFTKKGLAGIPDLLKYDTFRGFFKVEGKAGLVAGGRYRPLTPIMFAVAAQFFASPEKDAQGEPVLAQDGKPLKDLNPQGVNEGKGKTLKFIFHLMNVLWYGVSVVLLYLVLLRLMSIAGITSSYAYWVPFITALLFAAHPIHTEAVANIKGRDEIMCMVLSLAAVWFALRAYTSKNIKDTVLTAILFFLALMAKEMAVAFIPFIFMAFFVFMKKDFMDSAAKLIPFVIGFGAYLVVRFSVLGLPGGDEPPTELMNNPFLNVSASGNVTTATGEIMALANYTPMTFGEKMGPIFLSLWNYLKLLFVPVSLTHDYYPRVIPADTGSNPLVFLGMISYLLLTLYAIWGVFIKRFHAAVGVTFFLVSTFIISNIPLPIGVNMAERFMFFPSLGFCFVVAIGLYRLAQYLNQKKEPAKFSEMTVANILVGLMVLGFAFKTITRNPDWKDNFTLFKTDIAKSGDSAKLRNALGGELSVQSQKAPYIGTGEEKKMLEESNKHLTRALEIHPNYKSPYLIMGNNYFYLKQFDNAVATYHKALHIDSGFSDARNNLEKALEQAGITAGQQGKISASLKHFEELILYRPTDPKILFFLGSSYGQAGNYTKALENLLKAEQNNTDPSNNARIYQSIMATYRQLGDAANAEKYAAKLGGG